MQIEFSYSDSEIQEGLQRLTNALRNMQPVYRSIGNSLVSDIQETFDTSTSPWGERWAALAPATIAARRKGNRSATDKPLLNFGRLKSSIVPRPLPDGVAVGSSDTEGKVLMHQFGSTRRNVPARPFMPIRGNAVDMPETWKENILDMVQAHLERAMR